jgi:hypothetical protein
MALMQKIVPAVSDEHAVHKQVYQLLVAMFIGLLLIGALFHVATVVQRYSALRALAVSGIETSGTLMDVKVNAYTDRRRNQMYRNELSYAFATKDGSWHAGTSTVYYEVIFARGTNVDIVYDAANPARNYTRLSLEAEQKDVRAYLFFFLPILLLVGIRLIVGCLRLLNDGPAPARHPLWPPST